MKQQETKTLVLLYIFFFLVIVISFFTYTKSPEYTLFYFPYGIFYKKILYIVLILVSFLVLLKARKLYSKTNNIAMEIISAGFLAGIILYLEKVLALIGLSLDIGMSYIFDLIFGDLIWAIALFGAIFYIPKQSKNTKHIRSFIYFSAILYALLIISLDIFISPYLLEFVYKILPNIFLVKTIEQTFYLLSAFIYIDMRIIKNQNIFSFFMFGLIILGLGPLFFVPEYSTTIYAFTSPMIKIIGFIFIFIGLQDLQTKPEFLNFRQKLSSYLSLLLILSYIVIILISSLLFDMKLPSYLSYLFLGYFIVITIAQYILAANFSIPVMNITQGIERIKPGQKPEPITIISHDEIGLLAEEFNKNAELIWESFEKEKLLKNSITAIRQTLDINEVKRQIVQSICYIFQADRCFVLEYDQLSNKYLRIKYEQLCSSDIKSLKNMDAEKNVPEFINMLKRRKEVIVLDTQEYIEKNNLKGSSIEKYFKKYNIKSSFGLPIIYDNEYLGSLIVHFAQKKITFGDMEIQFTRDIVEQCSIAFYQAKQYEKIKALAAREGVLRSTIETIQNVLDIDTIKKILVTEIGKALEGDMSVFYIFDTEKKLFLPVDENSLYLSSSDIKSIVGINIEDYGWGNFFRKHVVEVIYSDLEKFIDDYSLKGTLGEQFIKDFGLKSTIGIPMHYAGELLGIFAVGYVREKRKISREDIELARTAANQGSIAFHQAKLYESLKAQVRKESLQRKFTEAIRSTLDIDEFIKIAVNEVGKTFKADRCLFVVFDKKNELFMPLGANYLSSFGVKEITDFNSYQELIAEFVRILIEKGENFISNTDVFYKTSKIKDNIKNNLVNFYTKYDIKSGYSVPVWGIEGENAYLVLHFTKKYTELVKDDLDLLKSLANQASIAFYQARLYEKQKKTAQREILQREIITAFRSTLDIDEIKRIIVTSVGKALDGDRVFISEYNQEAGYFLEVEKSSEYLASPGIKSITEVNEMSPGYKVFEDVDMAKCVMYFSDFDRHFKEKEPNKRNDYLKQYLSFFNVKSNLGVPIIYRDIILGRLVLHYTEKNKIITPDLIDLVQTVADQAGIAIYQTKQYIYEKLSRDIISTVRRSLNVDEIEEDVVNSIGKALNASRCFIFQYDSKKKDFLPTKYEYLGEPNLYSTIGLIIKKDAPEFFKMLVNSEEIIVTNREEYIKENNLEETLGAKFLRNCNLISGYSIPIKYADKLLGVLVIHYTKRKGGFSDEQIEFARNLANQIGIGIHQASLYEKERKTAQRESLLRELLTTIKEITDINETKKYITTIIGKYFNADRCIILEFDTATNKYLPISIEYLSSPDVLNCEGINVEEQCPEISVILEQGIDIYMPDTIEFLKEHNMQDSMSANLIKKYNVKSKYGIPIYYGNIFIGYITIHYTKEKTFINEEEYEYLRALASQGGVVLYQSMTYMKIQKAIEREKLLASVIETVRSSFDLNEIFQKICTKLVELLKIERIHIIQFPEIGNYSIWKSRFECKTSEKVEEVKAMKLDPRFPIYWGTTLLEEGKNIIADDIAQSDYPDFIKDFYLKLGAKSVAGIPIKKGKDLWGALAFAKYNDYKHWSEDEILLLESVANQLFIGIKQAELFEKEKRTAERETVLKNIIMTVRSTYELNKVKKNLINAIGKALDADRCYIFEVDTKSKTFLPLDEYSEYLSHPEEISLRTLDPYSEGAKYFFKFFELKKETNYHDTNEFLKEKGLENTPVKKLLEDLNVKSSINIPIYYGEDALGMLGATYTRKKFEYTEEDLKFIRVLASQTGIALHQSKLFNETKETAEREKLLRSIIETIRSTFDTSEIIKIVCEKVAKVFHVERASIVEYPDPNNYQKYIVHEEYKARKEIKGVKNITEAYRVAEYWGTKLFCNGKICAINDIGKFDAVDYFKEFYKELAVKSIIGAAINSGDKHWGVFVLSEINEFRTWTEEEKNLLASITDQLFIAIKQGKLYEATKKAADRERLIRKVLEVTRSTLDMGEYRSLTITEVGKTFNADRCFFRILEKKTNKYLTPEEEYLSSEQIKSLKTINLEQNSLSYLGDIVFKEGTLRIENTDKFIEKNNLQGSKVEDYFIKAQVKSDYAVPIWDTEDKKIHLVLHYCKEPVIFCDNDFNMMQILAQQSQIGLQQAMFYNEIKQKEEKERILREMLTGIKFTRDIDEIYDYLINQIVDIFNLDIACIFEPPEFIYTKIKNKCLIENKFTELSEDSLPEEFVRQLIEIKESQEFLTVNNVDEYYEDMEPKSFFNNHNVKSFTIAPLVKHDTKPVVLCVLFIASSVIREWSYREIDLLKSILDIAITTIWETGKLKEIEDLRNTFVLTLTHDFQVPLVGERKALEFLLDRPDSQPIGKFKDFINETITSNKELSRLLIMLLESYNYDSGKKSLELKKVQLKAILLKVIASLRELAESKSMTVDVRIPDDLPELVIDSQEIFKSFYTLLENAIVYTQQNGYIIINSLVQESTIATYISDNGPGIPQDIKNILFKRYETALAIERKIGSGLALYLSKQIVEAHKGIISYTSQVGKGSTFCIILPISNE